MPDRLPVVLLVLVLSACGPATTRHAPELDLRLPEAWVAEAAGDPPPTAWLDDLDDPLLTELVQEALTHNHDLAASAARLEQAVAAASAAGAPRWPRLDAGASAGRSRTNISLPNGSLRRQYSTSYAAEFQLSWEVDLWGGLAAQARAGVARSQAAAADLASAELSLAAAVARIYIQTVHDRLQLALAEDYHTNLATALTLVRARHAQGEARAADLALTESELAQAAASIAAWRRAHGAGLRALEVLLGRYPAAQVQTAADLPQLRGPIGAGIPADAILRRADLQASAARLLAANEATGAARSDLFPRLSLTAAGGQRASDLSDLLDPKHRVWNLIGNLTAPLFDGGRRRAVVRQRQAEADAALAAFRTAALTALREVEDALAAQQHLGDELAAQQEAAQAATLGAELLRQQYEDGQSDVLELLSAGRQLIARRVRLLSLRRDLLLQRLTLYRALGGPALTPEPTADLSGQEGEP